MQQLTQSRPWFKSLLIIVILLGIVFRFVNLDGKVYWLDETFTSLRISGYSLPETRQLYIGSPLTLETLHQYQFPNSEKNIAGTIQGLATEEPQLTPVYFIVARWWSQLFGSSITVIRSLSAVIGILAFPCLYWLCWELFQSTTVSGIAVALFAVSPFHVLYAQEARPYSLWTTSILLSSAVFLRAVRVKTILSWGIYTLTVIFGIYSHLFSVLIYFGHGIYLVVREKYRLSKNLILYLSASCLGFLSFLPWILVVLSNRSNAQSMTNWSGEKVSLISLGGMWMGNISRIFLDFGIGCHDSLSRILPLIPFIVGTFLFSLYAIYFLLRQTSFPVGWFMVTLMGVTALTLLLPDLILGGRRSGVARYFTPIYLGIQMTIAYLLTTQLTNPVLTRKWQRFWQLVMVSLFSLGIISCFVSLPAQMWWNKGPDRTQYLPQVAQIVNKGSKPLIISDTNHAQIQSLGHLLNPKVRVQLSLLNIEAQEIANLKEFSEIYIYQPSESMQQKLDEIENSTGEWVPNTGETLWRFYLKDAKRGLPLNLQG